MLLVELWNILVGRILGSELHTPVLDERMLKAFKISQVKNVDTSNGKQNKPY